MPVPFVETLNGTIFVHLTPGQALTSGFSFVYGAYQYIYTKGRGWVIRGGGVYDIPVNDPRAAGQGHFRNIQAIGPFVMSFAGAFPDSLNLQPYPVWSRGGAGAWASFHVDCRRLLQVTALLERVDGFAEIPLLDNDGKPLLGMSTPPMMMVRKNAGTDVDHVINPGVENVVWDDSNCFAKAVASYRSGEFEERTFGTADALTVTLLTRTDPVPHWVVRITNSSPLGVDEAVTVMVHLLGEGYGEHDAALTTAGAGDAAGSSIEPDAHTAIRLVWSQQNFLDPPDVAVLNERTMGRGAVDVANQASELLYLTTGASAGTSGGSQLFTHATTELVPMVMVLGNATLGTYVADLTAIQTWKPESRGMGAANTSEDAQINSDCTTAYYSTLRWETPAAAEWELTITNDGQDSTGTPAALYDRTFFAFSTGKGV